ncbi:Uncharacterised protein [uncultured Blautia sp.]|nr:Uncharacterised protein [uncultured Blautia sp.]
MPPSDRKRDRVAEESCHKILKGFVAALCVISPVKGKEIFPYQIVNSLFCDKSVR